MNLFKLIDTTGTLGKLFPGVLWLFLFLRLNRSYSFIQLDELAPILDKEIFLGTLIIYLSYLLGAIMLPIGFFIADLISDAIDFILVRVSAAKEVFVYIESRLYILSPLSRKNLEKNYEQRLREYSVKFYGAGGITELRLIQCFEWLQENSEYYGRSLKKVGADMNFYASMWLPIACLGFAFKNIS